MKFEVAVLVATFNRSALTRRALSDLKAEAPTNWKLRVYLADDGSTDTTVSSLADLGLDIKIISGPGDWYWARSMYEAENSIDKKYDAILWMNDDIELFEGSLRKFEELRHVRPKSVLVGQFSNEGRNAISYGGLLKEGFRPMRFKLPFFLTELKTVDTFNGNLVLIPKFASEIVGKIDGKFAHAYADIDFGLRAKKLAVEMFVVPGFSGICRPNRKESLRIWERLKRIHSPKGQPLKSQIRFLRRHGRWYWPLFLASPYLRALINK